MNTVLLVLTIGAVIFFVGVMILWIDRDYQSPAGTEGKKSVNLLDHLQVSPQLAFAFALSFFLGYLLACLICISIAIILKL